MIYLFFYYFNNLKIFFSAHFTDVSQTARFTYLRMDFKMLWGNGDTGYYIFSIFLVIIYVFKLMAPDLWYLHM